ncbi:uncharacterized protein LOC112089209 [Eutrema salsugineum]|uniref:uncharacterized protein LOC112089209 n=1 Tax=Eutrema salsugineum TaxID=72664 RepID=UPI000CED5607|nr:uncharacterized protein LOC112089209 [Eutrema salsugineum]
MVDKAWVHLCRADPAYEIGARNSVNSVASALGDCDLVIWTCIDCRNVDHHSKNDVMDNLVTRGMDETYKLRADWYHHGEVNCGSEEVGKLKTQNGWPDKSFIELLETLPSMLPEENVFHTSLYDVKKFLKSFHMDYEKIHACINDCCLFRKKLKKLDNCLKCKTPRWKTNLQTSELKKGVPQKVLRYFPIILKLKRMFRSEQTAKELRWHFTNKSNDGKLCHPVDSVTWDQMNSKYSLFAAKSRNIRLGLSTDGFNPFSMKNTRYSCRPVLLVNYNMAPDLCMMKENIMLSLLILGPCQPGNSIDMYLEPLIDDLQHLWDIGEHTSDAFSKTTFTMKAMLLWTISDLPAYGNLAGCRVKGKMGCPLCGKHTDSLWLPNSRKHVYMCHRKGLSRTHSYHGKKAWFDGKVEYGRKSRIHTGHNISVLLKNYKTNLEIEDEESESEEEEEVDEEELSRWKKRSTVFNLPYWERALFPPCCIVEIQKMVLMLLKIYKSLVLGKSCILKPEANERTYLQYRGLCRRKRRDYSVSVYMNSKDRMVIAQIYPVALKGLLLKGPRIAITRLCAFFNNICQRVVDREKISEMENKIVETICMFERFFPPSFFDIMVHLCVHLGREARLGGAVHFRWMYPFERHMKLLKDFVRNPARPEGCIAELYLAEECMQFCRDFLRKTTSVEDKQDQNTEYESTSKLEGRPISARRSITLTEMDKKTAHLAVIQNTTLVDPYVDLHLQYLQDTNPRCRQDATFLWSTHTKNFAEWLKKRIPLDSTEHDETLKWLSYGPRNIARSYTGYIFNGLRFHTTSVQRQTQNTGVYYEATAMCRASARDTSQIVDLVSYYGRVVDIILLDYNVFYIPLFRCQWAVRGNGVKVDKGFTLVNLNQSQVSFARDPFILASQAKQMFYSRQDESSNWYVVMRGPSRRYTEADSDEADAGPLSSVVEMNLEDVNAEDQTARVDCEGIYI